jgi:hypothetical protein
MLVDELLRRPQRHANTAHPEVDPLREPNVLQEAQLLEARVEALTSTVGLLFELRTAMEWMDANTAILVARGVQEFVWSAEARSTAKTAWNVVASELRTVGQLPVFELDFLPLSRMRLTADRVEFYVGDVARLELQVPDYGMDDDAAIRANLAGWGSSFSLMGASFLDRTHN